METNDLKTALSHFHTIAQDHNQVTSEQKSKFRAAWIEIYYCLGPFNRVETNIIDAGRKRKCDADLPTAANYMIGVGVAFKNGAPSYPSVKRRHTEYVKEKVVVPLDFVGIVVGTQFSNVKRLEVT